MATLIDFGLWLAVLIVASVPANLISDTLGTLVIAVMLLVWMFYFPYLNGSRGQSPGKALTGLRVVGDQSGQVLGGGLGIVRSLVASLISGLTCGFGGFVDLLFPLWDRKKQTLHDKVVRSVVLKNQEKRPFSIEVLKP